MARDLHTRLPGAWRGKLTRAARSRHWGSRTVGPRSTWWRSWGGSPWPSPGRARVATTCTSRPFAISRGDGARGVARWPSGRPCHLGLAGQGDGEGSLCMLGSCVARSCCASPGLSSLWIQGCLEFCSPVSSVGLGPSGFKSLWVSSPSWVQVSRASSPWGFCSLVVKLPMTVKLSLPLCLAGV